jgi:ankyrin repeat protein
LFIRASGIVLLVLVVAGWVQASEHLPLLAAAEENNTLAVDELLASGANPNKGNPYGITPLSLACQNGNAVMTRALLGAGAEVGTRLPGGETPLMIAARTGDAETVRVLLKQGAEVDATESKGQTALMWAAAEGNLEVVKILVEQGAHPQKALKSGFNAFFFAIREGHRPVVQYLLANKHAGANEAMQVEREASRGPKKGITALRLAMENGHFDLAVDLLEQGADANDQRAGYAPLHVLSWVRKPPRGDGLSGMPPPEVFGHLTSVDLAKALIKHGADVNLRLKSGASGGPKLGQKGATPFLLAAKNADLPYLKLLVEQGADPLLPNADGTTPFLAAAGLGSLTPEEEAGNESECLAVAKYLVSLGAEINTVNKNGETAMHGAAYKNAPGLVDFLVEHGADITRWNTKNKHGWTPLLIAQGYRPGNFKPDAATVDAIQAVMVASGVTPPAPPEKKGYGKKEKYTP